MNNYHNKSTGNFVRYCRYILILIVGYGLSQLYMTLKAIVIVTGG